MVGKPNGHVATARRLLGRAEYLAAYDEAARALEDAPNDIVLQHLAILALARAGATEQASERFIRDGLARRVRTLEPALAEDILALEARIAKDRALTGPTENLQALSELAAASYERVHRRFGRTYTAVNAATMWMLAGNETRARGLARRVLRLLPELGAGDYWQEASRAEAFITLGDAVRAREALAAAAQATGADVASRSITRRQLLTLCTHTGIDDEILDGLPVPRSMNYCGHVPASERLQGSDEQRVVDEVRQWLNDQGDVIAYGSLAAGADIIIAEAVIASGCELHVVLPFPSEEFEETSVLPFGEGWSKRYHRCLAAAETVTEATGSRQGEDDAAYAYCSSIAMGRAVIRSHVLARAPLQLAVWDGRDTDRIGGTSADRRRWDATGFASTVIATPRLAKAGWQLPRTGRDRTIRALMFADVKGYSSLRDQHIPAFVEGVMRPLAAVANRTGVSYRNTWGDAFYVVIDDVATAAEIALDLCEVMARTDLPALGIPSGLDLRVGLHAGPVFAMTDPVRTEMAFVGEHVTRAARIEPVAPPGAVYVTEAFAALLALETGNFTCEYVGQVPTAKSFGTMPMYLLRRTR